MVWASPTLPAQPSPPWVNPRKASRKVPTPSGYEHLNYLSSLNSTLKTIAGSIASSISTTYASTSGAFVDSMEVKRFGFGTTQADGGKIVPLYTY